MPPDGGRLTRHVSGAIPSDAGSARWKVEAVGGLSSSASRKGRVGWLDSDAPAGLFGQLQYPTPPLHVADEAIESAYQQAAVQAAARFREI